MVDCPSRPPKKAFSPADFPGTGINRVAVVLLLITPMAVSSAIMDTKTILTELVIFLGLSRLGSGGLGA